MPRISINQSDFRRFLSEPDAVWTLRLVKKEMSKPVAAKPSHRTFREGSKRAKSLQALSRNDGVTVMEGMDIFGWDAVTTVAQFYETAKLTGRKLVIGRRADGAKRYSLETSNERAVG